VWVPLLLLLLSGAPGLDPLAPLGLLVLAECPLLTLDHHATAVANRYRATSAPLGRAFTHQFPP